MALQKCNVNFSARILGWIFWCEFLALNFFRVNFWGGSFCWKKDPKNSIPEFGPKFGLKNSHPRIRSQIPGSQGAKSPLRKLAPDVLRLLSHALLGLWVWSSKFKNLLMPLLLMGCFPVDVQEVKRPLGTKSGKRPIMVGKRPIKEGKRPIKAMVLVGISVGCLMGCFRAPPPWRKTGPSKKAH